MQASAVPLHQRSMTGRTAKKGREGLFRTSELGALGINRWETTPNAISDLDDPSSKIKCRFGIRCLLKAALMFDKVAHDSAWQVSSWSATPSDRLVFSATSELVFVRPCELQGQGRY